MSWSQNSLLRFLGALVTALAGLAMLGGLAVACLLIAVSSGNPNRRVVSLLPVRTETTEIYLRNRTTDSLHVLLTVARPALAPDTIWWRVALSPEATGCALVLHDSLVVQALRFPLAAPVLLPGTADTLVIAEFDDNLPRSLRHHRRYNNHPHESVRRNQLDFRGRPKFGHEVRITHLPGQPDSLRLTLALAPDSALRVARYRTEHFASPDIATTATHLDGVPPLPYPRPIPQVRWFDAGHRQHQQRLPLARWLPPPPTDTAGRPHGHYLVRHYWDYR